MEPITQEDIETIVLALQESARRFQRMATSAPGLSDEQRDAAQLRANDLERLAERFDNCKGAFTA